jgi:sn-glycerol 3-phosphate transport system permease protein
MRRRGQAIQVAVVAVISLVWVVPLIWTVLTAFRDPTEAVSTGLLSAVPPTLANFAEALDAAPFPTYYVNTVIIVGGILVVQLVTITLAGYAFGRLRFPGKQILFGLYLFQMMLPATALIVPNYETIRSLDLIDNRLAIMLPAFVSGFGTFLMTQTFRSLPREFEDAAHVDGANWWQVLWHVYIALARPSIVAFALVSVCFHWNDFLWPLIVTNTPASRPLTVGLAAFTQSSESGAAWQLIMAGTLLTTFPLLIGFFIFQRRFISSFIQSGLK